MFKRSLHQFVATVQTVHASCRQLLKLYNIVYRTYYLAIFLLNFKSNVTWYIHMIL